MSARDKQKSITLEDILVFVRIVCAVSSGLLVLFGEMDWAILAAAWAAYLNRYHYSG